MIRLKDVSTNKFIMDSKDTIDWKIWYARRLLLDYNITDYQKLKDFLESSLMDEVIKKSQKFNFAIFLLQMDLKTVEHKIEKLNALEKKAQILNLGVQDLTQIDENAISITDNKNKGKILLCSSPLMLGSGIETIRKMPISQIKHLAGHIDSDNFKNCLLNMKPITPKVGVSIGKAIKFYDEQVLRQYFDTDARDVNLFFVNNDEKKKLAEEQISDIAEYIASNAHECVWGKLTYEQKKKLLAITSEKASRDFEKVRDSFINTISRYTTLTELENGILNDQEVVTVVGGVIKREKKKPIDRFIIG